MQGLSEAAALPSGWTMLGSGVYLGTYEMTKGGSMRPDKGMRLGSKSVRWSGELITRKITREHQNCEGMTNKVWATQL